MSDLRAQFAAGSIDAAKLLADIAIERGCLIDTLTDSRMPPG